MSRRAGVTLAVLAVALAVVVHGSFHRASRIATPSSLLADSELWRTPVRLVGVVSAGSIRASRRGVRFAVRDERGHARVIVHDPGAVPDALRGGRRIEVTGTFSGRSLRAQPTTLLVVCARKESQQHC